MSKVSIQGNSLGTGTLTIAAPNTNTDRTLTLPDETGTVVSTASTPTFTGAVTAPSFIPNGSSAPTNGLYLPAANTPGISSNSTKVLSVIKGSSLALEGATPQVGTGISFPATQSASTDANTLDDYEEGTWSPALSYENPGTSSFTYSERYGYYVKIGKMVYVTLFVGVSTISKGTASGSITITGLPFSSQNLTRNNWVGSFNSYEAPKNTTAGYQTTVLISSNQTYLALYDVGNNSTNNAIADPDAGSEYKISMTYMTA